MEEVYFSFKYKNKEQLDELSKIISIDHKTNAEVAYVYANKKEFSEFLKKDIIYQIIEKNLFILQRTRVVGINIHHIKNILI